MSPRPWNSHPSISAEGNNVMRKIIATFLAFCSLTKSIRITVITIKEIIERRNRWVEDLQKDLYVDEAINILGDLSSFYLNRLSLKNNN